MTTSIAEAYTHSLIENNYFAWLFEYKTEYEDSDKMISAYEQHGNDDMKIYQDQDMDGKEIIPADEDSAEFAPVTESDDEYLYRDAKEARKKIEDNTSNTEGIIARWKAQESI